MTEGVKYSGGSSTMGLWQKAAVVVALLSLAASIALLAVFFSVYQGLPHRLEEQEAILRLQENYIQEMNGKMETYIQELNGKMDSQETSIRELHGKLDFHKMHLHRVQKEMQVILSQLKSESAREESLRRREEASKIFTGEPSAPIELVEPAEITASDEDTESHSSSDKSHEKKKKHKSHH